MSAERLKEIYEKLSAAGNPTIPANNHEYIFPRPSAQRYLRVDETGNHTIDTTRIQQDFGFMTEDAVCAALEAHSHIRFYINLLGRNTAIGVTPENSDDMGKATGILHTFQEAFQGLRNTVYSEIDIDELIRARDFANMP